MRNGWRRGLTLLLAGLMALTPLAPTLAMANTLPASVHTAHTPHHDTASQQIHSGSSGTSVAIDQQACDTHQNCDGRCCAACAHCLSAVFFNTFAPGWRGAVMFTHVNVLLFSFTPLLLERPPQSHA